MATYTNVRTFKRGAHHADGSIRYCIGCAVERRARRRQATVTAISRPTGEPRSSRQLPVAFCEEHWTEEEQAQVWSAREDDDDETARPLTVAPASARESSRD